MRAWIKVSGLTRGFLLVSLAPVSTGAALAYMNSGSFQASRFLIILLAVWCYHLAANLLNEYYDFISGADRINRVITPFSGGTRVLVEEGLTPRSVLLAGWASLLIGLAGFIWLSLTVDRWLFVFGLIGFISPILYSVKPIWLCYRGLGELLLGLNYGPALVLCSYYAMAGRIGLSAWIVGISLGLLSAAIITINEFPDIEADRQAGKNNLVVRLGLRRGFILYCLLLVGGTALVPFAVGFKLLPASFLLMILPLAASLWIASQGDRLYSRLPALVLTCRNTIIVFFSSWIVMLLAVLLSGA